MVDYGISGKWAYLPPSQTGRANAPPEGFITIYEHHLRGGLRFPMPVELYGIVDTLRVPVARLHPNALQYLVTMCVFTCLQKLSFGSSSVNVIFCFTELEDWVSMLPCFVSDFFRGEVKADEVEKEKKVLDCIRANMATFTKQGFYLTSDTFASTKWGPVCSTAMAAIEKRKVKTIILRDLSRRSIGESGSSLSLESSLDEEEEAPLKKLRAAGGTSTQRSLRLVAKPVTPTGAAISETHKDRRADGLEQAREPAEISKVTGSFGRASPESLTMVMSPSRRSMCLSKSSTLPLLRCSRRPV
ncbi:hypothetical protein Nepgr_012765 [Nepenthes gracilis]|uniref:Uncharacterized protein n=1 Tax=Nepenthes gracilis TaxID=150966 RepID=A0AAD3SHW5_NEPGR|nr:hypothetical protein Nepgr_012765 [Nepenthes gracilis]